MKIEKKRGMNKIRIQHNKKLFWVIIVLMMILICLIIYISSKNESQKVEKECTKDGDCVKVQTSCCSCNMGGEEICAPMKNASEYALKGCPTGIKLMCVAMYNCKINSCKCEEGKCVAVEKENEE